MPNSKPICGFCVYYRMAKSITIENNVHLDRIMMSNPEMEKKVQDIVRKVLLIARRSIVQAAKSDIKVDTRQAYRSVKHAVYSRILGGSVSILNKQSAGKRRPVPPVVHRLERETNSKGNHRGGNRMPRSSRTEDLLSYEGSDLSFVLRFLNAGTSTRNNGVRNTGAIGARGFFGRASHKALQDAAQQLTILIDQLIQKEMQ